MRIPHVGPIPLVSRGNLSPLLRAFSNSVTVTETVDKIVGNYNIYRVIRVQPQNEDKKIVLSLNSTYVNLWMSAFQLICITCQRIKEQKHIGLSATGQDKRGCSGVLMEWLIILSSGILPQGNSKTSQLNLVITGHDRSSNLNDKIGETHWVSQMPAVRKEKAPMDAGLQQTHPVESAVILLQKVSQPKYGSLYISKNILKNYFIEYSKII